MTNPQIDTNPHADTHVDVAAYVLDALTGEDQARFEAHLAGCPGCRCQLQEFSETTAQLSAQTATSPPDRLRTDVLAAIVQIPQLGPDPAVQPPADTWAGRTVTSRPRQLEPTPSHPRRRQPGGGWTWRRAGQIVAAAAAAVVLAAGGWVAGRQQLGQSIHAHQTAQSRLLAASEVQIRRKARPRHRVLCGLTQTRCCLGDHFR